MHYEKTKSRSMSLVAVVHSLKTPGSINYVNNASVIRNVLCLHCRERDPNQIFHFMSLNKNPISDQTWSTFLLCVEQFLESD